MDVNKSTQREGCEHSSNDKTTHITSEPPLNPLLGASRRPSTSSVSSLSSQDSALDTDADDPYSSDMDGARDAYRRRRAQLMAGLENGSVRGKHGRKNPQRQSQKLSGVPDDKHHSDDGHGSDLSSMSTNDDVELSHMASEDGLTDDEETALTRKDKEHRKRKRRRNTRLDGRIAGNTKSSKQEQQDADKNVMKAMIVNILLIASWYMFSLSISIVSGIPYVAKRSY